MPDPIKRTEKVHIDELSCKATSTVQWFLENRSTTHPVTHNNELEVFVCGEKAFEDIATNIKAAKHSIDICCWGFDPGMELVRSEGTTWPRGETYGDLLIAAGKRKVKIRLLVWYSKIGSTKAKNMPGHSHGTNPWRCVGGSNEAGKIGAKRSVALLQEQYKKPKLTLLPVGLLSRAMAAARPSTPESLETMAREEYCHNWYKAAFAGLLEGITIKTRAGNPSFIEKSLVSEKYKPGGLGELEVEREGMVRVGTHHQKTLLIDYDYMGGAKAVGYVKGLNSVTDYWDTEDHLIENPKRECGGKRETGEAVQVDEGKKADAGFKTFKPYRDYACRIAGGALACVHANFVHGWGRAGGDILCDDLKTIPSALKRRGIPGAHSSVQIIRTQPEEQDKTAKEMYFLATDTAANATGYLYIENQYFQYQEWAERLIQARKNVMARWKAACPATGKTKGDMPLLHVFVVMPVAELDQMVPRTYDTLAVLGQQAGMTGQSDLIDKENKRVYTGLTRDDIGRPIGAKPTVVEYANGIDKPSIAALEKKYGLKVAVAMLQTSGMDVDGRCMRYREIYIHSKLLLVDDSFFSLGSANLNQRSMAVDSEINLATNDAKRAKDLRQKIWKKLSGGTADGKNGSPAEIAEAFRDWKRTMAINFGQKVDSEPMTGFLLPLQDNRSATLRLG